MRRGIFESAESRASSSDMESLPGAVRQRIPSVRWFFQTNRTVLANTLDDPDKESDNDPDKESDIEVVVISDLPD
jgi:hypothetical protein